MNDEQTGQPVEAVPAEPDAGAKPPAETADAQATREQALLGEIAELKERLMRQQAEFDNSRKRLRREADEASTRALVRFLRPLLVEIDHFDQALKVAETAPLQDFALGVTMIRNNLGSHLQNTGVQMVPSEGVFDPALHEVIAEEECADRPRGTIVRVQRPGWRLSGQLIRSAQVVVSKLPAPPPAISEPRSESPPVPPPPPASPESEPSPSREPG